LVAMMAVLFYSSLMEFAEGDGRCDRLL